MSRIIAKFTVWFSRFYFNIEKRPAEPDLGNVFILRWNTNQNGDQASWMAILDGSIFTNLTAAVNAGSKNKNCMEVL